MYIKKGDTVVVIAGKDKGKQGKISRAFPSQSRILIEGINMRKRHLRPRRQGGKGQITDIASPIHVSNVMLLDPKTKKPTRVGFKMDGGKKVRVSKKSGEKI